MNIQTIKNLATDQSLQGFNSTQREEDMRNSLTQDIVNTNNHLIIDSFEIRQDDEGRYCLNDLHKASGGAEKHKISNFLRNQQTKDLITEIDRCSNLSIGQKSVNVIRGGTKQGTYVVKELVYAYGMWISAKFHLIVIRAYDSLITERLMRYEQAQYGDQRLIGFVASVDQSLEQLQALLSSTMSHADEHSACHNLLCVAREKVELWQDYCLDELSFFQRR